MKYFFFILVMIYIIRFVINTTLYFMFIEVIVIFIVAVAVAVDAHHDMFSIDPLFVLLFPNF